LAQEKPDLGHLTWALDQRVEIQRTLLELYRYVRENAPSDSDWVKPKILDHLIAAGFSLWRAVFLSESDRDFVSIHKSQEKFLEQVLTNNAITFSDDKNNRAWTVSYYLENAKHRLAAAQVLAEHYMKDKLRESILRLLRLTGTNDVALTRYELECVHAALRLLLLILHPQSNLPPVQPALPQRDNQQNRPTIPEQR
jgi:hypothetical protein